MTIRVNTDFHKAYYPSNRAVELVRLVYHLLKYRMHFTSVSLEQADNQYWERMLKQLQRQAQLGAKLVFETANLSSDNAPETLMHTEFS